MNVLTRFFGVLSAAVGFAVLLPMHAYRRFVSPMLPARCRYYPTCSHYAVDAVRTYGPVRGFVLAAWRVVRCNPWSMGGIDEVRDQHVFRGRLGMPRTRAHETL